MLTSVLQGSFYLSTYISIYLRDLNLFVTVYYVDTPSEIPLIYKALTWSCH